MKIRIAYYIAAKDGKWLDDSIAGWTGLFNPGTPAFSHCEIWMPDQNGNWVQTGPCGIAGDMFTSTMRGDNNGTVLRPASDVLKHPERWHITEIEVDDDLYKIARNWAKIRVACNQGYDNKTIASFFWFTRISGNKEKAICSERCYQFLCECGVFSDKTKCPSPRRLSRWLSDMGYKPKPLV